MEVLIITVEAPQRWLVPAILAPNLSLLQIFFYQFSALVIPSLHYLLGIVSYFVTPNKTYLRPIYVSEFRPSFCPQVTKLCVSLFTAFILGDVAFWIIIIFFKAVYIAILSCVFSDFPSTT